MACVNHVLVYSRTVLDVIRYHVRRVNLVMLRTRLDHVFDVNRLLIIVLFVLATHHDVLFAKMIMY